MGGSEKEVGAISPSENRSAVASPSSPSSGSRPEAAAAYRGPRQELVEAAEAALAITTGMFEAFPYAEIDRDDAALFRFRRAISGARASFQDRVQPWMMECFGAEIAADTVERNHRFLEESLELVQALGCTADEAHQLVDYTYGRPAGEPAQEVGGVMVTLAALCLAANLDMEAAAETELSRIWTKVPQIRAKQAAKPKHSPLPAHLPRDSGSDPEGQDAKERLGAQASQSGGDSRVAQTPSSTGAA